MKTYRNGLRQARTFAMCTFAAGSWLLITASSIAAVLNGPVTNPSNNHSYYLLTSSSWTNSQADAVLLGGNLVAINDAAEDTWVFDTFATPSRMLWIGLNDLATEGQFRWVSGEPVGYTGWAAGEPNGGLVENWGAIRTEANGPARKWIDWQDNGSFFGLPVHGVVEVNTPEPSTAILFGAASVAVFLFSSRCRVQF